jgi:hypothetical protein
MVSFFLYASLLAVSFAYDIPTQPLRKGSDGQFELVGNSLISAQQVRFDAPTCCNQFASSTSCKMFLGTTNKVYIIDKVENNPSRVKDHPAWAEGDVPTYIL